MAQRCVPAVPGCGAPNGGDAKSLGRSWGRTGRPSSPRERPARRGFGIDRDALYKALSSPPSASAPGPSGLRFAHLQTFKVHPRALALLGGLCDRIADGDVPEGAIDLLGLTKLTPLKKDGPGIRPVAAGECLRKLAARALVREHRTLLLDAVRRQQYGAGRPGGAETLLHTVQVVSAARPNHAWVQLDVKNAFPRSTPSGPGGSRGVRRCAPSDGRNLLAANL